ncbi:MAG: ClbS/DfsB family four-helix bundle protein [Anaerolineales bacterium]|nr:ClbS/DfsB family four-helix bundle protein [Anaerolineales bacterium]
MNKSDLLEKLKEANQQWETLLTEIGVGRMEQPGVSGHWSMKDIIAHLNGWNRWQVARLQAAFNGDPLPASPWPANLQGDDEINAWIYTANHDRPISAVLADARQDFQQLIALIADISEDVRLELVEPKYLVVWVGEERFHVSEFFDHFYDDHEPDVRAWLARLENAET